MPLRYATQAHAGRLPLVRSASTVRYIIVHAVIMTECHTLHAGRVRLLKNLREPLRLGNLSRCRKLEKRPHSSGLLNGASARGKADARVARQAVKLTNKSSRHVHVVAARRLVLILSLVAMALGRLLHLSIIFAG